MKKTFNKDQYSLLKTFLPDVKLFPCKDDKSPACRWAEFENHIEVLPENTVNMYGLAAKPNKICIVDIDTQDKDRVDVLLEKFPATLTVRTGKGFHLYYLDPNNEVDINTVDREKKTGFDLRCSGGTSGGYVIAPGSYREDKDSYYEIIKENYPVEITKKQIEKITKWAEKIIIKGGRNDGLNNHLYKLRTSKAFTDEQIAMEAYDFNNNYCIPPLSDKEVDILIANICKNVEAESKKGKLPTDIELADTFKATMPPICQFGGVRFVYNGTHWKELTIDDLSVLVQDFILSLPDVRNNKKANISGLISATVQIVKRHSCYKLEADPFARDTNSKRGINFLNGAWVFSRAGSNPRWIERNDENEEELKQLFFPNCLPFRYDTEANHCPTFQKYINEFSRQVAPEDDKVQTMEFLLEVMGYAIMPVKPRPYSVIVYGGEGTGKSTMLKILHGMVGSHAYMQRSIKEMMDNRFSKADLMKVLIYADDDLPDAACLSGDFIKAISGEQMTSVERKNIQGAVSTQFSIMPFFMSNVRPSNTGADGLNRRVLVINVVEKFEGEPDNFMVEKICGIDGYEDERPAVFNYLFEAWTTLKDRNYFFDQPDTLQKDKDDWIAESDVISAWCTDNIDKTAKVKTEGSKMYRDYVAWATENGYKAMNRNNFYSRITSIGIKDAGRSNAGKLFYCNFKQIENEGEKY